MYKVFYNERTVFFIDNDQKYTDRKDHFIHYFKNKKQLKLAISIFLKNPELTKLFIVHRDINIAFKKFKKLYKLVDAAGGLVKNNANKILVIYRHEKWDLPKGKLEKKELPEVGALREVEEECGISNLVLNKLLDVTYHIYKQNGDQILKRTFWFEMSYNGDQKPTPQTEEDITEAKWVNPGEIAGLIKNTYGSIIDVFKKDNLL